MKNLKEKQINQICKKHPQWKILFLSYLDIDENISIKELEKTFSLIISYKSIFKNLIHEAKFFLEVKDNRSVLERLNDKVISDIHNHKKEQFINSLKSKKYKKLFNEEIEQEIHIILDNKISIESLKHQFFNKLAKYKNSNELLESLQSFKSKNIQWNREYYIQKIKEKKLNVDILQDHNGYMIIQTNDYDSCKELGSDSWCIVYEERFFLKYTRENQRQIIALNFDKPIEDNQSMIGFTLIINGKISCSYLKNDEITPKEIMENFHFPPISSEELNTILKGKTNQEVFYFICKFGFTNLYHKYLNKKDVDPSLNNNYSIMIASKMGNFDIVELLLKNSKVDPSADNNYIIRSASFKGHIDIVNRLLEDPRVDPSAKNNFAIRWASRIGHLDIVNRLLEDPRVDPSAKNNYSLKYSSEYGHIDIVNRLLEDPRVDPSSDIDYAIGAASFFGHFNVLNRLLEDPRVDPSAMNNYAFRYSMSPECRELLLKDIRVCKKLKPNWILKNLSEKEINIYKSTLSKSNNSMNIFKNFYFNLILKIKSN